MTARTETADCPCCGCPGCAACQYAAMPNFLCLEVAGYGGEGDAFGCWNAFATPSPMTGCAVKDPAWRGPNGQCGWTVHLCRNVTTGGGCGQTYITGHIYLDTVGDDPKVCVFRYWGGVISTCHCGGWLCDGSEGGSPTPGGGGGVEVDCTDGIDVPLPITFCIPGAGTGGASILLRIWTGPCTSDPYPCTGDPCGTPDPGGDGPATGFRQSLSAKPGDCGCGKTKRWERVKALARKHGYKT